jgi:hypothetical protein
MTTTRTMARRPPVSEAASICSTPGLASPRTRATTWAPTALKTYTGTASSSTRKMSSRASREGVAREGTMPSTSLLESRPDRIPPSAPALLRWAGTSTRSAGYRSNDENRPSSTMPAMALTVPATTSTGRDSCTIRRSSSSRDRSDSTRARTAAATTATPSDEVMSPRPVAKVATHSAGSVTTSPSVDTSGAFTLSRSHP